MKANFFLSVISIIVILSCNKSDDFEKFDYEATIVGLGDNCFYYVLNVKNISGDSRLSDGVFFAMNLDRAFIDENPFRGAGYVGTRIKFNCTLLEDLGNDCYFMGQSIPFVKISSAIINENQNEGIDQRKINNANACLPFREVYGTNKYDINQDSSLDLEFLFLNRKILNEDSTRTYTDLSIHSYDNLIHFLDGKPMPADEGDTIKAEGPYDWNEWSKFRPGIYLLRYEHPTLMWDETYWKFGESGYLKMLLKIDDKFHSAWIKLRIDLDSTCKCSVMILDSYYNPIPNKNCIVGFKE
jgi:hypothetical protein